MEKNKNQTNLEIKQVLNQPYKYGFETKIENEKFPAGINEEIIKLISRNKKEPSFLLNFRLKAFQKWKKMVFPHWSNLSIKTIDFNKIIQVQKEKKN